MSPDVLSSKNSVQTGFEFFGHAERRRKCQKRKKYSEPAVDDKVDGGTETKQEVAETGEALEPGGGNEETTASRIRAAGWRWNEQFICFFFFNYVKIAD